MTVSDHFPERVVVTATLDGSPLQLVATSQDAAPALGLAYSVSTGDLAEGTHDLAIAAVDGAGHSTTWKQTFLVNSSETFGARAMGPGAVGKDVKTLQGALKGRGLYTGALTGTYDEATAASVSAYRAAMGSRRAAS